MRRSMLGVLALTLALGCAEPTDPTATDTRPVTEEAVDLVASWLYAHSIRPEGDSIWVRGKIQPYNDFRGAAWPEPYIQRNRWYRWIYPGPVLTLVETHDKPFKTFEDSAAIKTPTAGTYTGRICSTQVHPVTLAEAPQGCRPWSYTRP